MMKTIILVTEQDIAEGQCGNPLTCPVALALRHKGFISVYVESRYAHGIFDGRTFQFPMPEKAIQFIKDFDNHKPVKPIAFALDI